MNKQEQLAEQILKKHWDEVYNPPGQDYYIGAHSQLGKTYKLFIAAIVEAMQLQANADTKEANEYEDELVEDILSEFRRIGIDTSEWEEKFGDGNFAHEFIAAGIQDYLDKIKEAAPAKALESEAEREAMIQVFAKVRKQFELRSWIMEGRGFYPYDDDRYKEEVRYLYDEFDALDKDLWKNIKSKTFEYRDRIIEEYKAEQAVEAMGVQQEEKVEQDAERKYILYGNERYVRESYVLEEFTPKYLLMLLEKGRIKLCEGNKEYFSSFDGKPFNLLENFIPENQAPAKPVEAMDSLPAQGMVWKYIGEHFPAIGENVIGYRPLAHTYGDPAITILKYEGRHNIDLNGYSHGFERSHHVTHWMPLPEPPSESASSSNEDYVPSNSNTDDTFLVSHSCTSSSSIEQNKIQ